MAPDPQRDSATRERSLSRRTVAKLIGVAAAVSAVLIGFLSDTFRLRFWEQPDPPAANDDPPPSQAVVQLPSPQTIRGDQRVETAIADRRSRRAFGERALTPAEIGQLCWAAQGITQRRAGAVGLRAAPSAGAQYPLELFVVCTDPGIQDVASGVFHYDPADHELERVRDGSFGPQLREIAVDQEFVAEAPLSVVITGVDERTMDRYGERGERRYVPMEAGHAGQNIYLQVETLDLSTVAVGAFADAELRSLLAVDEEHRPLYIFPVGSSI